MTWSQHRILAHTKWKERVDGVRAWHGWLCRENSQPTKHSNDLSTLLRSLPSLRRHRCFQIWELKGNVVSFNIETWLLSSIFGKQTYPVRKKVLP